MGVGVGNGGTSAVSSKNASYLVPGTMCRSVPG